VLESEEMTIECNLTDVLALIINNNNNQKFKVNSAEHCSHCTEKTKDQEKKEKRDMSSD